MLRKIFLSSRLGVFVCTSVTVIAISLLIWAVWRHARLNHFLAFGLGAGTILGMAWYISPEKVRQLLNQTAGLCRSTWRELIDNDPTCPDCGKKGSVTIEGPVGIPDVGQCRYKRYCSCPSGHIWTVEQVVQSTTQTS